MTMILNILSGVKLLKPVKTPIVVIGVGSLGSMVADSLSNISEITDLILYDHDIVSESNLSNSLYQSKNVGQYKVDAFHDLLSDRDVNVHAKNIKYEEGITKLPKSKYVFDCRDIICSRHGEIHTKFYISGRSLIIDCKKFRSHRINTLGKYNETLTKIDVGICGMIVAMMYKDGSLQTIIDNQIIHKYDIDNHQKSISTAVQCIQEKDDVIFDSDISIIDAQDYNHKIIRSNLKKSVQIVLGSEHNPVTKITFKMGTLTDLKVLQIALDDILKTPCEYKYFTMHIKEFENLLRVILVPETGGA